MGNDADVRALITDTVVHKCLFIGKASLACVCVYTNNVLSCRARQVFHVDSCYVAGMLTVAGKAARLPEAYLSLEGPCGVQLRSVPHASSVNTMVYLQIILSSPYIPW